jgi:hypothetical protein
MKIAIFVKAVSVGKNYANVHGCMRSGGVRKYRTEKKKKG